MLLFGVLIALAGGELELNDNSSGASIKVYKTLIRDKVCWSGNYYANGGTSAIGFCWDR